MGGIKFKIHPLFCLFGVYYAVTGRIFVFVIYTLCAVVHELGHSIVANSSGYALNKITLMPFGAVVSGNVEGLSPKDEFKIALAGPFVNLAIGLFFVALWWIFPTLYAFTDVVAEACFSMALMNFIPVYPLDGGRVLSSVLSLHMKKERAYLICRVLGISFAVALLGVFIASLFFTVNLSLLLFSASVFFGAIDKHEENRYVRIYSSLSTKRLKRGAIYKKHGVDKSMPIKKVIALLDVDAINEIVVFSDGKEIAFLSQSDINELLEVADLYSPIGEVLKNSKKLGKNLLKNQNA